MAPAQQENERRQRFWGLVLRTYTIGTLPSCTQVVVAAVAAAAAAAAAAAGDESTIHCTQLGLDASQQLQSLWFYILMLLY